MEKKERSTELEHQGMPGTTTKKGVACWANKFGVSPVANVESTMVGVQHSTEKRPTGTELIHFTPARVRNDQGENDMARTKGNLEGHHVTFNEP